MLEQTVGFFVSWFANPNIIGIGLAILFGLIWFAAYWTPILIKPWAWAVLISSAILSLAAVSFIQIPLQYLVGDLIGQQTMILWPLLAGIPAVLLSGLVQEGSKLVPVVIYWLFKQRDISPKLGLCVGAVAGLGFGIFEAVWIHNTIFGAGWSWAAVQASGIMALLGFWERFFAVAFHIAASALAGYGLAKGWGWQFYLLASLAHAILNYSAVLLGTGVITAVQMELVIAAYVVIITGVVLCLRWSSTEEEEITD